MDNEMLFSLMEDCQFIDIMTYDILDENSYISGTKFGTTYLSKLFDSHLRAGNAAKKKKDYKLALKEYNECKKLIPKLISAANEIPDDEGWSKFVAAFSTTGISLTKRYKDEKTGGQAYYRIFWKEWISGINTYLDKAIQECKDNLNK